MWKSMTPEEKKPYIDLEIKDRERYENEKKEAAAEKPSKKRKKSPVPPTPPPSPAKTSPHFPKPPASPAEPIRRTTSGKTLPMTTEKQIDINWDDVPSPVNMTTPMDH
jgi:hypothetical protein